MKILLAMFILSSIIITNDAQLLDLFHCKSATWNDFYYGLKKYPRQKDYVNVCHETIRSLEHMVKTYGKCYDEKQSKLNSPCIYAFAKTIKTCVQGLYDVPERVANHFCGYRLTQNCAKYIGVERFPTNNAYRKLDDG